MKTRTAIICSTIIAMMLIADTGLAKSSKDIQSDELTAKASELLGRGQHANALPLLDEALKLNPENTSAIRYMAIYRRHEIEPYCRAGAEAFFANDYTLAISSWEHISLSAPLDMKMESLLSEAFARARAKTIADMYSSAEGLLASKLYMKASSQFEKIIADYPDEQRARDMLASMEATINTSVLKKHYDMAKAFALRNNYKGAEAELEKILLVDKEQELAKRMLINVRRNILKETYSKARGNVKKGLYLKAREDYSKILKANPTDKVARATVKNLDDVMNISTAISGESKPERLFRVSLLNYIMEDGEPIIAISASWYANQLYPENTMARTVKGFVEERHQSTLSAMPQPENEMNVVEQTLFRALNHIYEGHYDLAINECKLVLALEPKQPLAMKRLGSAYYLMGRKDLAKTTWTQALEITPEDQELSDFLNQE